MNNLARLPRTREEVKRVATVIPDVTVLLGPEASEQAIIHLAESGELDGFDTIHLATHAFVDDERPEHSALALSRVDLPDPLKATMAGERIFDVHVAGQEVLDDFDVAAAEGGRLQAVVRECVVRATDKLTIELSAEKGQPILSALEIRPLDEPI